MQKVRLWEVISDKELQEIPSNQINLEERLEDWLATDISVLDPNLLVIGRQVRTDFGGQIDLLCLDSSGDTVVVELKKGQTPRDVTAQALDYASWVKELSLDRIASIAGGPAALALAFQERFERPLPDELNLGHRSLIVAESMDSSTERIVRYLSDMNVPINVATIQHFKDESQRSILAQVYLIEPEEAEAKYRATSKRANRGTVSGLQALADETDIGPLYTRMRSGVRGILSARPYSNRVWYQVQLDDGGMRTVLIISAIPDEEGDGMGFTAHADRFKSLLGIDFETLQTWLPPNSYEWDLKGWAGSAKYDKDGTRGIVGFFQSTEEVDKFVNALRSATNVSPTTG